MAKFTIITDSCCNLFPRDINSSKIDFHVVPLTLILDGEEFVDDENLDVTAFVKKMGECKMAAKSACPSPEAFAEIMRTCDNILLLTLGAKLSGTYASAMAAAELVKTEHPNKKIFVLDTMSAAAGQDHIVYKLRDKINNEDLTFDELTVWASEIAAQTRVRFLLQDISNLVKNGRMSKVVGKILHTAKIKLICGEDGAGEIKKISIALGTRRGLNAIAELSAKELANHFVDGKSSAQIMLTHVFNDDDAAFLKTQLENRGFSNITTHTMRGLSSLYAAEGGIVVAY